MKTGTTFLQQLLAANRADLAAAGYLFPGSRWREQDLAARDILDMTRNNPTMRARCHGMWDKLTSEMLAFEGHASIFSMEFLSFANAAKAARVVGSLPGAEVHVILTVRDAVGVIPAQWQTSCRNGGTISWPAFARSARWRVRFGRFSRGENSRVFVMAQGIPRMLRAWGRAVPSGRLHVVTVPPSGSDPMLLWERFADVVGMDPAVCTQSTAMHNTSLGQPSADLLRRINARLGKLPSHEHQPTLKAELATGILSTRSGAETGAALDGPTLRSALSWNQRVRTAIEHSGAHVVGDLSDLPVKPSGTAAAKRLSDPAADDLLAAAETARDGLVRLVKRRRRQLSKGGEADDQAGDADVDLAHLPTTRERWGDAPDPVDAAVTELSALALVAIDLHRRLAPAEEQAHHSPAAAAEHD
jgi:hypothetical protein